MLIYSFEIFRYDNDNGYVTSIDTDANTATPDDVIFGYRNVITYSNTLYGKYSLNNKMNFNISIRHYWSYSENKKYLLLQPNGRLVDYLSPVSNQNQDFSTWNFDLNYSWWIAPGSQLSILYRNNSFNYSDLINKDYGNNVKNLLNNQQLNHIFSISLKYYIDYNSLKNSGASKTFTKPKERIRF